MSGFFPASRVSGGTGTWFRNISAALVLVLGIAASGSAGSDNVKYDFSGYTCVQGGKIVKGNYMKDGSVLDTIHNLWQGRFLGGFNLAATVAERLEVEFNPECIITHSVFHHGLVYALDAESVHSFYFFYLNKMAGTYTFGDLESPLVKVTIGYFPFTYNPYVKSLGEYLFRSMPYPQILQNDFASIYKRLGGLHASYKPIPNLKFDFLLNMELMNPVGDFTPSLLGSYTVPGDQGRPIVEVGGGISFTRALSVDPLLTSPHRSENAYKFNSDSTDTSFFSFAGTKAMIRFGFDPKPLFQGLEFFGAEDLKLYGELSMLGLKDYGVIYPDLKRRMPMMLGFNVPTFRLLDFLSVEVEYWWQKYSNNYSQTYWAGTYVVPHPYLGTSPKAFPWYWSVFAQKTLTKGVKLMAEATRNHYFTIAKMPFYQDRCESTPSKGDWLYTGRVQFEF